jgi:hypothetical protein
VTYVTFTFPYKSLFVSMMLIKPAKGLPADAQVGGDQVLGHDVVQLWIHPHQLLIPRFRVAVHKR